MSAAVLSGLFPWLRLSQIPTKYRTDFTCVAISRIALNICYCIGLPAETDEVPLREVKLNKVPDWFDRKPQRGNAEI